MMRSKTTSQATMSGNLGGDGQSSHPLIPEDPQFFQRVLHYLATAVVVVNASGDIVYVNNAMLQLGGWDLDDGITAVDYIHPEDRDLLARSFRELAASPSARVLGGGRPWAEIYFRVIAKDGAVIPIELVGAGGVLDPAVNGIIYEARPASSREKLHRVLEGLGHGASMHQLLSLVVEMIADPPLDFDAAILQSTNEDDFTLAASSSSTLTEQLARTIAAATPWENAAEPRLIPRETLPPELQEQLRADGYHDLWSVCVATPFSSTRLRILACSPAHHVPNNGPRNRLAHTSQLAAAVLLRSQSEQLLDPADQHDGLTDLPNRVAFYQVLEGTDPTLQRAALHIRLTGHKRRDTEQGVGVRDAVLQIVADRIRSLCHNNELIGRIGDDGFVVVALSNKDQQALQMEAETLARQVHTAVSEPIMVAGRPIETSASIGVATSGPETSGDVLLTWADSALHDAKRAGGRQTMVYQP